MPRQFYYVYVLRSLTDGLFYVGFSENLRQRVREHSQGKNTSTRGRRPLELVFYESFPCKADALKRERYLKTTKGKVALRLMLKNFLGT